MQLYAVAISTGDAPAPDLGAALTGAAAAFRCLDGSPIAGRSRSGRVAWARIAAADAVAAPRRYAATHGEVGVMFDGFPIERMGRFGAHDAAVLLERWDAAVPGLEGIFSAVRIDAGTDEVEVLLDVLGMAPVFVARAPGLTLVANSVRVLRDLGCSSEADRLGIASLVALGWPADGRTLLAGVRFLTGGGVHRFSPAGERFAARVTPRSVLARRSAHRPVTGDLMAPVRAAAATGVRLTSALSSGRDTRALLALLHAAGVAGRTAFFTTGAPADLDVEIGRRLAARYGLDHRVQIKALAGDPAAWRARTAAFVSRGDGLSSLEALSDDLDHDVVVDRLALELWGAGGEVARKVKWVMSSLGGLTPGARDSYEIQRRLLRRTISDGAGLVRPEALEPVGAWLDAFVAERRAEGWPARDVVDVFYAFGRVRHWAARGVRRAASSADLYSPFVSQAFVEHGLGMTPGARYVEQAHHRLIHDLLPDADAEPYEFAWRPQHPRAGLAMLVAEAARRRTLARAGRSIDRVHAPPLGGRWFEEGLAEHRPLADVDSPVWEVVDRDRYRALLDGPAADRAPHLGVLCRVLTALWWLHDGP